MQGEVGGESQVPPAMSKLSHPTSTSTFQIPQFPIPTACREIPIPAAEREIPIPAAGREFQLSGIRDSHGDFVSFCGGWSAEADEAKNNKAEVKATSSNFNFHIPDSQIPNSHRLSGNTNSRRRAGNPNSRRRSGILRGLVGGSR